MRENMALLFVKPMRNAINTSFGSDVLAASKLIPDCYECAVTGPAICF